MRIRCGRQGMSCRCSVPILKAGMPVRRRLRRVPGFWCRKRGKFLKTSATNWANMPAKSKIRNYWHRQRKLTVQIRTGRNWRMFWDMDRHRFWQWEPWPNLSVRGRLTVCLPGAAPEKSLRNPTPRTGILTLLIRWRLFPAAQLLRLTSFSARYRNR